MVKTLGDAMVPAQSSGTFDLVKVVHQALKDMHREGTIDDSLREFMIFRDTQQIDTELNDRQVLNKILKDVIEELGRTRRDLADVLQLRFFDRLPVYEAIKHLDIADSTLYERQRNAIAAVSEIIWNWEQGAKKEVDERISGRLPIASYNRLIGVDEMLNQLTGVVRNSGPPWIISIEGIGGIGKTSVADALLRRTVEMRLFNEVGWFSSKPFHLTSTGDIVPISKSHSISKEEFVHSLLLNLKPGISSTAGLSDADALERLRSVLNQTPYLVVIDNLETIAELDLLVPLLQQLANPSKFILTSRERLYGEENIFLAPIPELSRNHALQLMRQEAEWSNLPQLARAGNDILQPIYDVVGGNPLAIRLVVGLLHVRSLKDIVSDLRIAHSDLAGGLYTYIFRNAWDNLNEVERRVLLTMPLLPIEGDTLDYIGTTSGVESDDLSRSILRLTKLNLVDVRGDIYERLYSIHNLTRTFLLEHVVEW